MTMTEVYFSSKMGKTSRRIREPKNNITMALIIGPILIVAFNLVLLCALCDFKVLQKNMPNIWWVVYL